MKNRQIHIKSFVHMVVICLTTMFMSCKNPETKSSHSEDSFVTGKTYKTTLQWSEAIDNSKYLNEPHCIHLDSNGNLLIADMNNARVMRFTKEGKFLNEIGKGPGNNKGYFNKIRDIAVSLQGNYVVTDQKENQHRVQIFNAQGNFLKSFANQGNGSGQIDWPHGLDFDSKGNIYVTDVANQRVNKYDPEGNFILDIGKNNPNKDVLTMPHGITITPNDAVFVSDYFGTIQKYNSNGEYQLAFRNIVHTRGSDFVHTICSDYENNVYLMVRGIKDFKGTYEESPVENRSFYIAKYDNNGNYLETITISDKGREVIHATVGKDGKIYALFKGNGRMGVEILSAE